MSKDTEAQEKQWLEQAEALVKAYEAGNLKEYEKIFRDAGVTRIQRFNDESRNMTLYNIVFENRLVQIINGEAKLLPKLEDITPKKSD